jgi:hypothetical protein
MLRRRTERRFRVLGVELTTLAVLASSMVIVPATHGQHEIDPTWFDSQPEASKTAAQHASQPPSNIKRKQQKSGPATHHHSSNQDHTETDSNHYQSVSTSSVK